MNSAPKGLGLRKREGQDGTERDKKRQRGSVSFWCNHALWKQAVTIARSRKSTICDDMEAMVRAYVASFSEASHVAGGLPAQHTTFAPNIQLVQNFNARRKIVQEINGLPRSRYREQMDEYDEVSPEYECEIEAPTPRLFFPCPRCGAYGKNYRVVPLSATQNALIPDVCYGCGHAFAIEDFTGTVYEGGKPVKSVL